jgi:S1-C subfamily serine protease
MKIRSVLIAGLLVGGFIYLTSVSHWNPRSLFAPVASVGRLWSEPDRAKTAGLSSDELNNIEIYKSANQATVNIRTIVLREDWFFIYPVNGAGSGFLIDVDGRVLTNNHVVAGRGAEIKVILADRSEHSAKVLYQDPSNDLALLKIEPKNKLPFLRLGESNNLQVGQKVLAIGNPFGLLEGTLTTGIISSLHRTVRTEDGGGMEDMVQTDAAINPGNSGGPLLDSQGSVIGINAMILGEANVGLGFAIPIDRAKSVLQDFRTESQYGRPQLGVNGQYLAGDLAQELNLPVEGGILVFSVESGSVAQQAGIRGARQRVRVGRYVIPAGGDFITAIDGRAVDGTSLDRATRGKKPGDAVELTISRDGRTIKVKVVLGRGEQQL